MLSTDKLPPISRQIWEMKYRYCRGDGTTIDQALDDSWRRVADAVAAREKKPKVWATRFRALLEDFQFLPGGRILANAGTERQETTMFNCYVMGSVPDSIEGIFQTVKEAAQTQKQGGGVGFDFSTLRPCGSPIAGVDSSASGPLSFMQVFDATCRTIMSAGQRRGAQMGIMRCDHPDIEAFIEAKRQAGMLRMFNLSVAVTDAFIEAVRADADWELVFDGKTYKTLKASELWDRIMHSTYDFAEPGIFMVDRVNRMNNLWYCEDIRATNPCVTADTWIQTSAGPRQAGDLLGRPFAALVDGVPYTSGDEGFFSTGRKPVLRLETREGYQIRLTADHLVLKAARLSRYTLAPQWVPAASLQPGDCILLHNQRPAAFWNGAYTWEQGYLLGLLLGDGTLKADKAVICAWPGQLAANGGYARPGVAGVMETALAAARTLPHRADFAGWMAVPGRGEYRLACGAVRRLAAEVGMAPGAKAVTPSMESASSDFCRGFLRGLFDTDGSVQGSQRKGVSIRLAQNNMGTLRAVQRMLLRLGIASRIYGQRRRQALRPLPDGKGSSRLYLCQDQHELVISSDNVAVFADGVGFADTAKHGALAKALAGYRRACNRERFVVHVREVVPAGEEDVFDAHVPGVHAFDANGLYVHNCGEQPLPPYGACLLGSFNLTRFVDKPFAKNARFDFDRLRALVPLAVRFLDNVIEFSNYPLPRQKEEAMRKRRMGIGITGLADTLIFLGLRYGAPESLKFAEQVMRTLTHTAYEASADLAAEKGAFPAFDKERYLEGAFVRALPQAVRRKIAAQGMRNSHLTSIAPTGTISLLACNISSGIEPVFATHYTRKVRNSVETDVTEYEVMDYAYLRYVEAFGRPQSDTELPPAFVTADRVHPREHVDMQAALQQFVDSSISKTINVPADFPFDEFKDIYLYAHGKGLKGCTTFRPSEYITGVLVRPEEGEKKKGKDKAAAVPQAPSRPQVLRGTTYKIRTPLSKEAFYVTINDLECNGVYRPYEVFINTKNLQHFSWLVAMTRLISAIFRNERDPSFLVEELQSIYDPAGGYFSEGEYVPSLPAEIGRVIATHLRTLGIMPEAGNGGAKGEADVGDKVILDGSAAAKGIERAPAGMNFCPSCNQPTLVAQENCLKCLACGYSKCG